MPKTSPKASSDALADALADAFPAPPDIPGAGAPILSEDKQNGAVRLFRKGIAVTKSRLKSPLSSPPDDPGPNKSAPATNDDLKPHTNQRS